MELPRDLDAVHADGQSRDLESPVPVDRHADRTVLWAFSLGPEAPDSVRPWCIDPAREFEQGD